MCLSVSPHDKTKMAETTITRLATEIVHHDPGYAFNIRSKVKVTGSQSAKNIEGDRVAGVSLHSVEWPASSFSVRTKTNSFKLSSFQCFKHRCRLQELWFFC